MRQTLGTGMMAPLAMADNFHGDYYAGPSGAAMGALMAGQAIGDALQGWGGAKGRQQDEAKAQAEKDRMRMEELNQRQAVAQAISPGLQMNSSNGMSNRDMTRKMALPDAGTQMSIYKMQESKAAQEQAARDKQITSLATLWYANGGEKADPGGANFQRRFGVSPYEYVPQGVVTSMANLDLRRDMADEGNQTRIALAQMAAAGRGGGGGKLPSAPGYESFYDEMGQVQMRPIPGGPADLKLQAKMDKTAATDASKVRKADLISQDIDRAVEMAKDYLVIPNTGVGSVLSAIPGTKAHDLSKMLDGVKARIGFDSLQEMRDNSPTGGALGQVSEMENRLLQATFGSLEQSQSEDEFIFNLRRLKQQYNEIVHGPGNAGGMAASSPQGAPRQQANAYRGSVNRSAPQVGEVRNGYRFKGGNPADRNAWEQVNE
ncbi:MAG: hypothetical protein RBR38_10315 [Desulfomicrobium apsheronum]|nr:hypothetical protein [Desulfomicrobium apsheronum]